LSPEPHTNCQRATTKTSYKVFWSIPLGSAPIHPPTEVGGFLGGGLVKTYLELGIGDGGSFLLDSFFCKKMIKVAHCVDSACYPRAVQSLSGIEQKIGELKLLLPESEVVFYNETTDVFFGARRNPYDCIFIDADHSYEGVKKDFENSLMILGEGGRIIMHDINSNTYCPGLVKFWKSIKNSKSIEFVCSEDCGIGIWTRED